MARRIIKVKDLIGKKIGRLTILSSAGRAHSGAKLIRVLCECGRKKTVQVSNLYCLPGRKYTKSCGCLRREHIIAIDKERTKHGHCCGNGHSPTYYSWLAMMGRCYYPSYPSYRFYGAKGILVCERWHTFSLFLADMGSRPEDLELSRQDETKGYEPGNVKWETRKQNLARRDANRRLRKLAACPQTTQTGVGSPLDLPPAAGLASLTPCADSGLSSRIEGANPK